MLQFLNKMPKQQEPKQQGPPKINKPFIPPNNPSLGSSKPATYLFDKKPAFHQTGNDLHALLRSRHTKETIHRGKHGPDYNHAANLFDHAHHGGGMGVVRGGHHVGHGPPRPGVRIGQFYK